MIDVGAGHGEMCVLFKLRGNHHPVIAVDPEEGTHERIVDIMQLNRCEGIDIVTDYIGARPNLPLDDFPVSGPGGFIKIDVDGGEVAVLRSGETLLRRDKPSLLIETHSAELENECLSFLTGLGYRCTIIKNAWWRFFIPEYRTIEHNRWLWAE